jgi:predicted glycoside hydrolase/deacetylase ChbG (UPF0249 family)
MRIILFLFQAVLLNSQTTLQEKLGYSAEDKLLIIHADDLGLAHSENAASTQLLNIGNVRSASIMVPCPWFYDIAEYSKTQPHLDFGLHLTLTSEWKYYKWGSVASPNLVPGLLDEKGYMYPEVDQVYQYSNPKEADIEIRAQIDRALAFGIDVTHLDSHMGTLFWNPEFMQVIFKAGQDYKLPVMLSKQMLPIMPKEILEHSPILLDFIYMANPEDYKNGMDQFYKKVMNELTPGVHVLLLHAAFDDEEMKAITVDHPDYGAEWRQRDFDFFSSEECSLLIKNQNIKLITWREIRDKLIRK